MKQEEVHKETQEERLQIKQENEKQYKAELLASKQEDQENEKQDKQEEQGEA